MGACLHPALSLGNQQSHSSRGWSKRGKAGRVGIREVGQLASKTDKSVSLPRVSHPRLTVICSDS